MESTNSIETNKIIQLIAIYTYEKYIYLFDILNAAWYQPRLTDWAFMVFNTHSHSSITPILIIASYIPVSVGCTCMETAAFASDT